jgi:predicted nucleic-acid-binding Zn-ribbon protein
MSDNVVGEIACPKCKHQMVEGFIPEFKETHIPGHRWAPGKPRIRYFSAFNVNPRKTIPITMYRCVSCGYLESYAK